MSGNISAKKQSLYHYRSSMGKKIIDFTYMFNNCIIVLSVFKLQRKCWRKRLRAWAAEENTQMEVSLVSPA